MWSVADTRRRPFAGDPTPAEVCRRAAASHRPGQLPRRTEEQRAWSTPAAEARGRLVGTDAAPACGQRAGVTSPAGPRNGDGPAGKGGRIPTGCAGCASRDGGGLRPCSHSVIGHWLARAPLNAFSDEWAQADRRRMCRRETRHIRRSAAQLGKNCAGARAGLRGRGAAGCGAGVELLDMNGAAATDE